MSGLSDLRVAAVQATARPGQVSANVESAVGWVGRAAGEGARLVVLPELYLPGYDPKTLREHPDECDVTADDPRLRPLAEAAAAADAAVVVGASVRGPHGRRTLSLLTFSAAGRVSVAYSKQHLWDAERGIFEAGSDGASAELQGWDLGLGICYDGCFPEHARAATDAGALAYLCPSAYVVGSEHRRDLYYPARAIDNAIYVVFSGLAGRCGELEFSGGTAIYDPQGRAVARVEDETGVAVADLSMSVITEARRINPYETDRVGSLGGRQTVDLAAASS
ncbi:MAG: carbon-nitrogen hydrolase family protein [Nocardioidaceae bacterium]